MLDRLLHHGHVLKCGPRSWRTKPAPLEKANDKCKSEAKQKRSWMPGKNARRGRDS